MAENHDSDPATGQGFDALDATAISRLEERTTGLVECSHLAKALAKAQEEAALALHNVDALTGRANEVLEAELTHYDGPDHVPPGLRDLLAVESEARAFLDATGGSSYVREDPK